MRPARSILPVLLLAAVSPGAEAKAVKRDANWVREQFARFAAPQTPFRLRARLELVANDGTAVPGVYEYLWASEKHWRQEIRVADYRDSEGLSGDRAWSSRSLPFRPWNVRLVTFAFYRPVRQESDDRLEFKRLPPRSGRPELACAGSQGRWICADAVTGAPVLQEHTEFHLRNEYGPIRDLELGPAPSEIRLVDENRVIGRIVLERFESIPSDLTRFEPPQGAEVSFACSESRQPRIVPGSKVRPEYPRDLQQIGVAGYVLLQATIDESGRVTDVQPLRASHPRLVEPSRDAVAQWRYEPAVCDGKPRKVQIEVVVQFHLK